MIFGIILMTVMFLSEVSFSISISLPFNYFNKFRFPTQSSRQSSKSPKSRFSTWDYLNNRDLFIRYLFSISNSPIQLFQQVQISNPINQGNHPNPLNHGFQHGITLITVMFLSEVSFSISISLSFNYLNKFGFPTHSIKQIP